jgi:hypothetical protein
MKSLRQGHVTRARAAGRLRAITNADPRTDAGTPPASTDNAEASNYFWFFFECRMNVPVLFLLFQEDLFASLRGFARITGAHCLARMQRAPVKA